MRCHQYDIALQSHRVGVDVGGGGYGGGGGTNSESDKIGDVGGETARCFLYV